MVDRKARDVDGQIERAERQRPRRRVAEILAAGWPCEVEAPMNPARWSAPVTADLGIARSLPPAPDNTCRDPSATTRSRHPRTATAQPASVAPSIMRLTSQDHADYEVNS